MASPQTDQQWSQYLLEKRDEDRIGGFAPKRLQPSLFLFNTEIGSVT